MPQKNLAYFFTTCLLCLLLLAPSSSPAQNNEGGQKPTNEQAAALADILADEQARNRLIEQLRALASSPADEKAAAGAGGSGASGSGQSGANASNEGESGTAQLSLARRLAQLSQGAAEDVAKQARQGFAAVAALYAGRNEMNWAAIAGGTLDLVLTAAAAIVAFFVLRTLATPLFNRAGRWAEAGTQRLELLRRLGAVLLAAAVDLCAIGLAWMVGYAVALFGLGNTGDITAAETLFLNAFLLLEAFKAVLRLIFAPRNPALRLLPLGSDTAARWNGWLARLSGFAGYGMLVAVPLLKTYYSPALGPVAALLIISLAFLYAAAFVLSQRKPVRSHLQKVATQARFQFTAVAATLFGRIWHWLAIAYFAVLAVLIVSRPEDALPILTRATAQSLLAIGIGIVLSVLLTQAIGKRIRLPGASADKFPRLEARLNAFVPTALNVVRILIMLVVAAVLLDAWGVFDFGAWLTSDIGAEWLGRLASIALVIAGAVILWIAVTGWIENRLSPETGKGEPSSRERTLLALLGNAVAIVLIVITLMICLSEIGLDIGPLLAGAGVLGLAIGFGAQKLVQDIITGVFIQLENAINTGDVVTAAGVVGVAERLSIRSVGIRDLSGTFHVVPFSSVDVVSNYMREFAYHIGEYGVAYREDTDEVISHLRAAFDDLKADPENGPQILEDLEVHGVTAFADSAVNVRVRIKTLPGSQWAVGRAYNRLVKRHFDAANIEIPFPHTTVYFGHDKSGAAPAGNLRILSAQEDAQQSPEAPSASSVDDPSAKAPPEARANPKYKGDFSDDD